MEAEALRSAIEHAGLAAAGIGFLAGLAFGFNPVALASIPVSLAYVTKGRDRGQALLFGSMFILGLVLMHGVLGVIAGLGSKWAADLTGRGWGFFLGPITCRPLCAPCSPDRAGSGRHHGPASTAPGRDSGCSRL